LLELVRFGPPVQPDFVVSSDCERDREYRV
jgi:hypothetical protein